MTLNLNKIGNRIALLRRERGYTGEKLAELLNVTPQAISKWENGRCLPETAILPLLSKTLDCSIDSILLPRELFILEAVYTDGCTDIPVTGSIDSRIWDHALNLCINPQSIGAKIDSDRLKLLTVKYQTPDGIYYTYALENEILQFDRDSHGYQNENDFQIIGAFYGTETNYMSALKKMEHYEYFHWDTIPVNQETFPSSTASDSTEYLTLIYLNKNGIHTVSCAENHALFYNNSRTELALKDTSRGILPGIMRLSWGHGMECPWAGSLYAALNYMGEDYTYEQLMGMSGACYRTCFVDVWDWSCTDALVAFDYATPLFKAIGYSMTEANRLEKDQREAERLSIMKDIQENKPVLAMNLRVAPEWGLITGYLENGKIFLCRTYFDQEIFEKWEQNSTSQDKDQEITFQERGGYLVNDFWPFLIAHFGDKKEKPSDLENLMASLKLLSASLHAKAYGGYRQGEEAYEAWIHALSDDDEFDMKKNPDHVLRRIDVNKSMLMNLSDARHAAAGYLSSCIPLLSEDEQPILTQIADNFCRIYGMVSAFYEKIRDSDLPENLRREEISLLRDVLIIEKENDNLAGSLLKQR